MRENILRFEDALNGEFDDKVTVIAVPGQHANLSAQQFDRRRSRRLLQELINEEVQTPVVNEPRTQSAANEKDWQKPKRKAAPPDSFAESRLRSQGEGTD